MCLAIPGQVEEILDGNDLRMARVNFGGIRRSICLHYTPDATAGDFVLVHVGFAISMINEEEAKRTYNYLVRNDELTTLKEELSARVITNEIS